MSEGRINELEARVEALEARLAAQDETEARRRQVQAALGVPAQPYQRPEVDERSLGVVGVPAERA
jgi:hypothetical protein